TINAQYRLYNICQNRIKAGDHLLINGNDIPLKSAACPDPTGNPPQIPGFPRPPAPPGGGTSKTEEFPFELYFNDIGVLLALQSAIDAAQRAAVDRWLGQQEETFRQEINRQLGTDHGNFRDAQRDFFGKYEENWLELDNRARGITQGFSNVSNRLDTEQEQFTEEFVLIEEWRVLRETCRPIGQLDCDQISDKRVRGVRLGSTTTETLNRLWDDALVDFSEREYESALNRSWAAGLGEINRSGSLLSQMVNNHITYYNQKGLQDKIFLMTAYLTQYNRRSVGPVTTPLPQYSLPLFWDGSTLAQIGKDNAPSLTGSQSVFQKNFLEDFERHCRGFGSGSAGQVRCFEDLAGFRLLQEQIVNEHMDGLLEYEEFGMTMKMNRLREGYRKGNGTGKIAGLDALSYKNFHLDGDGPNVFYELDNGAWVYRSNSERSVNNGNSFSEPSLEDDGFFYYIYNEDTKRWHELLLPASGISTTSDPYLVAVFWNTVKQGVRYATPLEDALIIWEGKDLDGVSQSELEAGVWLVVGFVPGGKVLKPLSRGTGKLILFAKANNKTIRVGFKRGGEAFETLKNVRKIPGRASGNGVKIGSKKWLRGSDGNAGFFPKAIADKMRGKNYPNFDKFREEFWENVADNPNLANQFSSQNQALMRQGKAPKPKQSQWLGEQNTYILHHQTPINQGGKVYDVDNLIIVTPRYHKEILLPSYHFGYGY
ncbi:MAG: hypothetical protein AAF348_19720, partial [Bacteroidota bacterium]